MTGYPNAGQSPSDLCAIKNSRSRPRRPAKSKGPFVLTDEERAAVLARFLRYVRLPDGAGLTLDGTIERTPAAIRRSECWRWTGAKMGNARSLHPALTVRRYGMTYAHRLVYELVRGPIPAGHDLHHVCGRALCVFPFHLTPLPHALHAKITGWSKALLASLEPAT